MPRSLRIECPGTLTLKGEDSESRRYRDSDDSIFPHFCCKWPIPEISYPVFSVKAYNNLL